MAASYATQLVLTLRFLHLTTVTGEPTPRFVELVSASETERPFVMGEIVRQSYHALLGQHDVASMSLDELRHAFSVIYGVDGNTQHKSIVFFVHACRYAQMGISPDVLSGLKVRGGTHPPRKCD